MTPTKEQGVTAVAGGSLAPRRIPIEIRTPSFYAKWEVSPGRVKEFLAFACECILVSDADNKQPTALPENKAVITTCNLSK